MRIAIVGTGVSGLVAAHLLARRHDVVVFESADRLGGHTNTVDVPVDGGTVSVDTGFLVYNERNYPGFVALLDELGVRTQPSDMSFSVSDERHGLEWRGSSLSTVFAQRRRIADPRFLRMLADVVRFNRSARALLDGPEPDLDLTVEDLLAAGSYSRWFRDWYLVPMGASIWSADPTTFTRYPAVVFARFFDNHGLLRIGDQPRWRTVSGGARHYVDAIAAGLGDAVRLATPVAKIARRADEVEIRTADGSIESVDHVVVATHSDQALDLLSDPTATERDVLGAIAYQPNVATLHTDSAVLPHNRRARAAWNYHAGAADGLATLTYDLNVLQSLPTETSVCVTLNRPDAPHPDTVVAHIDYAHPVFDAAAVRAQRRHGEIDGVGRTSYCGAYWGYGFHEDGVQSAVRVARSLGVDPGWSTC